MFRPILMVWLMLYTTLLGLAISVLVLLVVG
jgi:hypothetical protein